MIALEQRIFEGVIAVVTVAVFVSIGVRAVAYFSIRTLTYIQDTWRDRRHKP